jgi:hypothetical protein
MYLLFAEGTKLEYTTLQQDGSITILVESAPIANVVIESIMIFRT